MAKDILNISQKYQVVSSHKDALNIIDEADSKLKYVTLKMSIHKKRTQQLPRVTC